MKSGRWTVEAPAKVNLFLRILERQANGYHRLETAFQAVGLTDTLEVTARDTMGVTGRSGAELELEVVDPEGRPVDVGPVADNLVTRAVGAFRDRTGTAGALRVRLTKRIPAGAGLGGGSSDAGAMLRLLNHLHGGPLPTGELVRVGAQLGADVAFFAGDAALALGRGVGTDLTALPPLPPRRVVLGMPPVHVATGPAYGRLAASREGKDLPSGILDGPGWPPAWDSPGAGGAADPWGAVGAGALNDFEPVVAGGWPEVADALGALDRPGVAWRLLSGSGAAVFGLLAPGVDEDELLDELGGVAPAVTWRVCGTLGELPAVRRVEDDAGML